MSKMTGGEAMVRAILANGIDTVFGLPGAQIYPLFDAIHRLKVNTVTTRHEQGAAYMAYGAAKSTGKSSAFAVVPGPGVLNTSAALCTAMGACAPVLCMTGQVPSSFLGSGRGYLHELEDQAGTLKTLIKDAVRIDNPEDTSQIINQAFSTMLTGRSGPVSVEMCWDVMAKEHELNIVEGSREIIVPEINEDEINAAIEMIKKAKHPMIMCGAGAQHASTEVLALAECLNAPVTAFRSGRGVVAEDHDLGVSSVAARELWDETDLLIGIGSRLEMIYMRWGSMNKYLRKPDSGPSLIRIDIDPEEMQRFQPDLGIVADSANTCTRLIDKLSGQFQPDPDRRNQIATAKARAKALINKIQPQVSYWDLIRDVLPRDGFIVPELSQMGFTSYYGFPVLTPRTYVTEGFQGTLGYGFQTGLGVKVANPGKVVLSVTGDGGFMFGVQELSTAVAYDIGLITLVFNNNAFENVRRDQMNSFGGRLIGSTLHNPDFLKLAESFGISADRVDSPETLKPVLEKAINENKPALIEISSETGSETSPWDFIEMNHRSE